MKPIYARLQNISEKTEYLPPSTNNKKIAPVLLKNCIEYKNNTYDILGIPADSNKFPYYWLILNAHNKDGKTLEEKIISISSGNAFHLSCNYLQELKRNSTLDSIVNEFLEQNCANE